MPRNGLIWTDLGMLTKMLAFEGVFQAGMFEVAKGFAEEIEAHAQENAKWEDRTGDARAGLTAEATHDGFTTRITLAHTVDYGLWLEIRWSGAYAIIMPTIEEYGPMVMSGMTMTGIMA